MSPQISPAQEAATLAFLAQLETRDRPVTDIPREEIRKHVKDFARFAVMPAPAGVKPEPADWVVDRNEYARHFKGTAYIAIGAIAKKVAQQQAKVFHVVKKKSGTIEKPVPATHPLVELLENVNPLMTQYDLWWHMVAWRLTTGDSFWWKARNGLSVPSELWPIPSQWVWAIPSAQKFIECYKVEGFFGQKETLIKSEEMIHIREPGVDWSNNGRFYGTPMLAAAATQIDLEEAILNRLYHHFKNFVPPGMQYTTDEELDEEQVYDLYQQIMAQRSSAEMAGGPVISHSGLRPSDVAGGGNRELDYTKSIETVMDMILAVAGTPRAVVGMVKDTNRANMMAALSGWIENVINPLLVHSAQHLTRGLAKDFDERLIIRFDPVRIEDKEAIRADVEVAQSAGAATPNEVREILLGRGPFEEGGDRPLLWGGMAPAPWGEGQTPEEQELAEHQHAAAVAASDAERAEAEAIIAAGGSKPEEGKAPPPAPPKDEAEESDDDTDDAPNEPDDDSDSEKKSVNPDGEIDKEIDRLFSLSKEGKIHPAAREVVAQFFRIEDGQATG